MSIGLKIQNINLSLSKLEIVNYLKDGLHLSFRNLKTNKLFRIIVFRMVFDN